jgi:hypothetical protein
VSKAANKKKYRKQRYRQAFPWPLVALGGLFLVIAVFLFANKVGGGSGSGTPAIAVDEPTIDYGYVKFGENRQFKIKVTNTGDGLLRFKEKPYVEVLEGC